MGGYVEVASSSEDTRADNFEGTPRQAAVLDHATAPLTDLQAKGLLDQTLVVLATEFGRTPQINDNDGRDRHNKASTCMLAGAGIRWRGLRGDGWEGW